MTKVELTYVTLDSKIYSYYGNKNPDFSVMREDKTENGQKRLKDYFSGFLLK